MTIKIRSRAGDKVDTCCTTGDDRNAHVAPDEQAVYRDRWPCGCLIANVELYGHCTHCSTSD